MHHPRDTTGSTLCSLICSCIDVEFDESQLTFWVPSMIVVFCPLGNLSNKKAVMDSHLSSSMTSRILF